MKRNFKVSLKALVVLSAATVLMSIGGCSEGTGIGISGSGSVVRTDAGRLNKDRIKLVLTGSSTVAPVMHEIASRFEKQNPTYRIDVQTGGSSRGIGDAKNGVADIGMASRKLKSNEQSGLTAHPIAVDGICLIVHQNNPIGSLTDQQVKAIYRGEITNWKQLGGEDARIVVINKAEGRGTLEVFLKHFSLEIENVKADLIAGDNQQVIKSIQSNPGAVGYVSVGAADYEVKHAGKIKLVQADGVNPTMDAIRSGDFPITRPLLLITKGQPSADASALIRFAQSDAVHDLIEAQYFVPSAR
jgi:phosphate transport system substrate-binding protein